MEDIVFATNNAHKLYELRKMLDGHFRVLGLTDIGCHDDIPEDGDSFSDNALAKAQWVADRYGYDCAADDSGLCVDALDGAPGIHSARFAGNHDSDANNAKLMALLEGQTNRRAAFHCVIALVRRGMEPVFFHGKVDGNIIDQMRGSAGFGYDPLFVPEGWTETFAEVSDERKNAISHRGRAVAALCKYLDENKTATTSSK